ncbi:hypothetical protein GCM10023156_30750 [Novipirellula rosea]|uniref:Uncharacterized protein n=1 Tax=Novipirellula rosea TaxID=1031540 RepID=A0ABP8MWJ0_9BACT
MIHLPSGEVRAGGSRLWVGLAVLEMGDANSRSPPLSARIPATALSRREGKLNSPPLPLSVSPPLTFLPLAFLIPHIPCTHHFRLLRLRHSG